MIKENSEDLSKDAHSTSAQSTEAGKPVVRRRRARVSSSVHSTRSDSRIRVSQADSSSKSRSSSMNDYSSPRRRDHYDSYGERPSRDSADRPFGRPTNRLDGEQQQAVPEYPFERQRGGTRKPSFDSDAPRRRTSTPRVADNRRKDGTDRSFNKNNRSDKNYRKGEAKQPRRVAKPVKYESNINDLEGPVRLNRFLSNSGVASRRQADELITNGEVKVNGVVVTEMGTRINANEDKVECQGQPVILESKVYVLLNKPKNCVTTTDDPRERHTVMHLVQSACRERIYPVGRLDRNTTGLLLLTNDGDLAARLLHPKYEKKKIYHVFLDRPILADDMKKIAEGIELEDGEIHADAIGYVDEDDQTQVGVEIHSGRNRIIRRIFLALGYNVRRLDRVYFAGLTKENLPRGRWRYLTAEEVRNLRMGKFDVHERAE